MKKTFYLALAAIFAMFMAGCGDEGIIISFDTDGGSSVPSITLNAGDKLPSDYFRTGSSVPVKDGYRFMGWLLDGAIVSTGRSFYESATLTAQWALRVTVNFELGSVRIVNASGKPEDVIPPLDTPPPVTIDDGAGLGSRYQSLPSWTTRVSGKPEDYDFDGWYNNNLLYTVRTPIVTEDGTFTLTARWTKEYVPADAPSPAIHPGNHFQETGGRTREVRVNEHFYVSGLFSNTASGGVLSAKWYRVLTQGEADAATANVPTGTVVLEQNALADNPNELSLPFDWVEDTAGTYWYYVVVTNYYEKATTNKYSRTITQNKLKVTVTP
jgi:uncharacterized repeat protein (TIGR02543 family)